MFDVIHDEHSCPVCGETLNGRKGATYCSPKCRLVSHRSGVTRTDIIRDREYINDLNNRYCEGLYSLPREERLGYMEKVARLALEDDSTSLRRLLTQKPLIYFKDKKKPGGYERMFPQAMNMYLKASPYRMNIFEFLASCPDVPEDEGLGWDYTHVKPQSKGPAPDSTGEYLHPFYKDMYPVHWKDRRDPPDYSYDVVDHETRQVFFSGSYKEAVEHFRETISVSVLYIHQSN